MPFKCNSRRQYAEDINVEYQKSPDADSDKMIFDAAGVRSTRTPHHTVKPRVDCFKPLAINVRR